jgi:hypothetical protein
MRNRVEQPPVNPFARDTERHEFWPGFVLALIGLLVVVCGARHLTEVETLNGNTAWETQLVRAFSSGGLQYGNAAPLPGAEEPIEPAIREPPTASSQRSVASGGRWKVRVNTDAKTPCPT